jgi:hypothetical protein
MKMFQDVFDSDKNPYQAAKELSDDLITVVKKDPRLRDNFSLENLYFDSIDEDESIDSDGTISSSS